ncbi:MAG TPA: Na+/H+ antiporter NhaC family protein [Clostridiales bacterium]|nr:Na+/H+ antiporter NhaC family protein [Clostridiales bacterium]
MLYVSKTRRMLSVLMLSILLLTVAATPVFAAQEEYQSNMYATIWSLVPPTVAIVLALVTKEVYISLFVGILAGGLFYANFNPVLTVTTITDKLTSEVAGNMGIMMFLVILGILVALMNKAGGSAAYGRWAARKITTRKGALLSTVGLGLLIFVDDYFNCLTVGNVMMPVTDKYKVSRAKLAYLIDATAAPICIIAPISSWAAAVTSSVPEGSSIDGFNMFLRAIPYNLYALLTIAMMILITLWSIDFGSMRRHELLALNKGDLFGGTGNEYADSKQVEGTKGTVLDLLIPVIVLIISCVVAMIYTGGFFEGESFVDAFANCDSTVALPLGSLVTLFVVFLLYIPRKVITFREFADCLPEGFRQMVPALLILSFAWTLSGFCNDSLGADVFVANAVAGNAAASIFLPAVFFLIALGLAFATGTSWGTFGILIPIVVALFSDGSEMLVISISACLAGAVCGDHISPISDTTIMASTGAQCNHIAHVYTQIPYAMLVAGISFVGYIIAGFVQNAVIVLVAGLAMLVGVLLFIRARMKGTDEVAEPAHERP